MRYQTHQLNERTDNFIRAAEFRSPKWIPANVGFLPAAWFKHGEELEKIVLNYRKYSRIIGKAISKKTSSSGPTKKAAIQTPGASSGTMSKKVSTPRRWKKKRP